jgi:predicted metalloprotease with PDZ domain
VISYRVDVDDPRSHHFALTLTLPDPAPEQIVSLPVWIPGSYLVREFARHLSALSARQGSRACAVEPLDKTTWRVRCQGRGALTLRWRVYAFDTSVRAAFVDERRGFFNGTSLLLRAHGREHEPHRLRIGRLGPGWSVATAMTAVGTGRGKWFEAAGYDELVDHPVALGAFWRGEFVAAGVPHELVVVGAPPGFDGPRLLDLTQRICRETIAFWHGEDGSKPPFGRYVFLLHAAEEGYGGLEHRASTALTIARRDLPRRGDEALGDGQVTLLGLISHEYFHAWSVKRLKPAEFARLDLERENYTRLLWFFEGFTSYYDDLLLRRAGLIDAARYLKLVAKAINAVATTPGRRLQSVAEASFDAWNKYYRADENTPNATVSYYQKGALIALALDLRLRRRGASLDAVMRRLWRGSGGGPIGEDEIAAALRAVGRRSFAPELAQWVHGRDDLPLAEALAEFGISWRTERAGWAASLGLRLNEGPVTGVQVKSVLDGSAAAAAGVSAGDELLAIDGWRLRRFDDALTWVGRDQPFALLVVRDQRLVTLTLRPDPASPLASTVALKLADRPAKAARERRRGWIDA